jgi:hypothetical protein
MTTARAPLSSLATTLDELTDRVTEAADALSVERGDLGADLYEVERSLRAASRRLASVLREI